MLRPGFYLSLIGQPIRELNEPKQADGHPKPEISYFDAFGNKFSDPNGIQVRVLRAAHFKSPLFTSMKRPTSPDLDQVAWFL